MSPKWLLLLVSGAVGEGGHHVAPALGHRPAVLLPSRALELSVSPGAVRLKGEHLLQVLKHVVEDSSAEAPLLELPLLSVHSLPVGLEVAVKVSLLVGLIVGVCLGVGVGVEVVLVVLLTKSVIVFENVIKVEGLVVLVEVVVATSSCSSSVALTWRRAMAKLVVLSPPLVI